jgi:DNA adenine methylase
MKPQAPIEIVNDINSDIVNFFEQLRANPQKLAALTELTPYSEAELRNARIKNEDDSALERARKFIVRANFAHNGIMGDEKGGFSFSQTYSRQNSDARVSRWNNTPERLMKVAERLKTVLVRHTDAINLISEFRYRPATLLYLDPPYFADRSKGYDHDQTDEEFHVKLLESVQNHSSMILISAYESNLYSDMLESGNNWKRFEIDTNIVKKSGERVARKELVYANKNALNALKKGSLNINLTENEIKNKKLNPERK